MNPFREYPAEIEFTQKIRLAGFPEGPNVIILGLCKTDECMDEVTEGCWTPRIVY